VHLSQFFANNLNNKTTLNYWVLVALLFIFVGAVFGVAEAFVSLEFLQIDIPYVYTILARIKLAVLGFSIILLYSALAGWKSFIILYGLYVAAIILLLMISVLLNMGNLSEMLGGFEVFAVLSVIPAPYVFLVKSLYKEKLEIDDRNILIRGVSSVSTYSMLGEEARGRPGQIITSVAENVTATLKEIPEPVAAERIDPSHNSSFDERELLSPKAEYIEDSKQLVSLDLQIKSSESNLEDSEGKQEELVNETETSAEVDKKIGPKLELPPMKAQLNVEGSQEQVLSNLRAMAGLTDGTAQSTTARGAVIPEIRQKVTTPENSIFERTSSENAIAGRALDSQNSDNTENPIETIGRAESLNTLLAAGLIGETEYKKLTGPKK
jgi:hypothetical protein